MTTNTTIGSGNFSSILIWSLGHVPREGEQVVIANGHTVTVDSNAAFGASATTAALTIQAGGKLTSTNTGATWTLTLLGYLDSQGDLGFDPLDPILFGDGSLTAVATVNTGYLRVELRNSAGALQHQFMDEVLSCEWSYRRLMGCEVATVNLSAAMGTYTRSTLLGMDLQIVVETASGPVPWWRGEVLEAIETWGHQDRLTLEAAGWGERLKSLSIVGLGFPEEDGGVVFEGEEYPDIADIVREILTRVADQSGISYTGDTVQNSGLSLERIQFNGSVYDALRQLGELAGNAEIVLADRNKQAHFRAASSTLTHVIFPEKEILALQLSDSKRQMMNRVHLQAGGGNVTLENEDDYVSDQEQTAQDGTRAFGKVTTYQKLLQIFTPVEYSMSAIELKLAKTGFGASTEEGFEGSTGGWAVFNTPSRIDLDSNNPHSGSQCLKVYHVPTSGKFGAYKNYTVTAGVEIRVGIWARTQWEKVTIELCDGSGANNSGADILDQFEVPLRTATWTGFAASVTPSGATLGVRAYATNAHGGIDPFWLDDLAITPAGAGVRITLHEQQVDWSGLSYIYPQWGPSAVIPYEDIPDTTPAAITVKLIPPYLNPDVTYAVQVESLGTLSDTAYFLLGTNSAGGYGSGLLRYYNGTAYVDDDGRDAYFKIQLPASQQDNGIYSRVIPNQNIQDPETDGLLWAKALIATLQSPVTQGKITLAPGFDTMIEANVPLGTVQALRKMSAALRPERIHYTWAHGGLVIEMELGAIIPAIGDLLAYIEYVLALRNG